MKEHKLGKKNQTKNVSGYGHGKYCSISCLMLFIVLKLHLALQLFPLIFTQRGFPNCPGWFSFFKLTQIFFSWRKGISRVEVIFLHRTWRRSHFYAKVFVTGNQRWGRKNVEFDNLIKILVLLLKISSQKVKKQTLLISGRGLFLP